MADELADYLAAIPEGQRPLFDRMRRLVLEAHPEATQGMAYGMPTFVVGERRLHVGVWKHGLSLYGWDQERNADFVARHPELESGKGTIRLSKAAADRIPDDELRELAVRALDP